MLSDIIYNFLNEASSELKKEKNTQILREFQLQVISEYFPDYEENIKLLCSGEK